MNDEYISKLENETDSMEFQIESMKNQIQLMYKYIGHLEDCEKSLLEMMSRYHDDECSVCDRAYKNQDDCAFQRGVFNGCAMSGMENNNWVIEG